MPTLEEHLRLELPSGTPVILLTRVAYDTAGRAVETTGTVKAAGRSVLEYRFRAA